MSKRLIRISRELSRSLAGLEFALPTAFVYDPLTYARAPHELYLSRYGGGKKEVLFLGMNPGPFGMAQTGIPFGDIESVKAFLKIEAKVGKPPVEHPKRPILGFEHPRGEVSGARLWGLFSERSQGNADIFFKRFFIVNYCPLLFLEESGRNRTPDKLPLSERAPLLEICDRALRETVEVLDPEWVIGVGAFAARRARDVLGDSRKIGQILHPSPASPKANRGWAEEALRELGALGISL